jgi:hypothetical protein
MPISRISAVTLLLVCALTACVRPAAVSPGVNISSDGSDYSPTARLAVALAPLGLAGDTIDVVIDSGSLSVPGVPLGDTAVTMRSFHLTALVVGPGRADGDADGLPRPWHALAQSDSIRVLDGLRRGEQRAIGKVHLRIPRPVAFDPKKTWLVFRITGIAVPRIALREGQPADVVSAREMRFRVYACADWSLAGRVDRSRSRQMRVSYLAAC